MAGYSEIDLARAKHRPQIEIGTGVERFCTGIPERTRPHSVTVIDR